MHRVTVNGEPVKRARHHDEHVPDDVICRYLLSEHKHMSDQEELGCKVHHDERGNHSRQMSSPPQPSPSLTFSPRMKNRTPATYATPPPAFRVHSISSNTHEGRTLIYCANSRFILRGYVLASTKFGSRFRDRRATKRKHSLPLHEELPTTVLVIILVSSSLLSHHHQTRIITFRFIDSAQREISDA